MAGKVALPMPAMNAFHSERLLTAAVKSYGVN
jgi:hypothetical protein